MERFFHPGPLSTGENLVLDPEESKHLVVLRKQAGDSLELIDGQGHIAVASIVSLKKNGTVVRILSVGIQEAEFRVRLCLAIPKPSALEFALRHTTELGVHSIVPLVSAYSQSGKGWNAARWNRIVQEACKQSQQARFPLLLEPLELSAYLGAPAPDIVRILCDENARAGEPLGALSKGLRYDVFVGAEGGWSDAERQQFAGVMRLGLGPNRLRAETAAIVATTLVKKTLGELC